MYKYRLTSVRGKFYLYFNKWSVNIPWFTCGNKETMRSYIAQAGIKTKDIEDYEKCLRKRLYSRMERIIE